MTATHAFDRRPPSSWRVPPASELIVAPRSPDDRVGELADALGLDPRRELRVDGRPVGRHETLARAGLVRGSRLEPEADRAATTAEPSRGRRRQRCGSSARPGRPPAITITLGPGCHVVGRAATASHPDRRSLGRAPSRPPRRRRRRHRSLRPAHRAGPCPGRRGAGRGEDRRRAGCDPARGCEPAADRRGRRARRHRCRRPPTAILTPTPGDPWRRTLRRPPRALPLWAPQPVAVPSATTPPPRPSGAGLAAAAFTLAGSAARRGRDEVAHVPPPRRRRRSRLARPLARRPHPRQARRRGGPAGCASGSSRRSAPPSPPNATRDGGTTSPPRRPLPTRSPQRPPSGPTCGPDEPTTPMPSRSRSAGGR